MLGGAARLDGDNAADADAAAAGGGALGGAPQRMSDAELEQLLKVGRGVFVAQSLKPALRVSS